MKKQEHNTTKTSFLTKFKNTKIGFKIIIIGGILALVATTIIVPIVLTNKGDSSNPKPNVDNRENDNNEDDNNEDDNNEDDNKQEKTDSYVPWHWAYIGTRIVNNATQSEYDYINDQISTTQSIHPGNQAFMVEGKLDILFNQMSKMGINKDEVLKNKANDKIVDKFIRFLGYDFGTSKTFANVFYQLKEDSAKWYYEIVEITGFGKPNIAPQSIEEIAREEFRSMVLSKDFIVSSDLSTIGNYAFYSATFTKDAKFSLAQTKVKSISESAFSYATLPNGFVLNDETNSIGLYSFQEVTFDKEAKFSLAQTQVKLISNSAFAGAQLPNGFALNSETNFIGENAFSGAIFEKDAKFSLAQTKVKTISMQAFASAKLPSVFALNDETTSIAIEAFYQAYLNPGFKIPNTVTSIAQDAFKDAILPPGYAWYDKGDNKQTITATNYPKAGWYVGKI